MKRRGDTLDKNEITSKQLENFHWNVYALRMNKGWTQQRLADEANLSHVAVSRIEASERDDMYIWTALSVANALGVDIGSLFCKKYELLNIHRPTGRRTNREKGML